VVKRGRRQWRRKQQRRGQAGRRRETTGVGMHDKAGEQTEVGKCQACWEDDFIREYGRERVMSSTLRLAALMCPNW
jgi:hypothetical protein